MDDVLLSDLFTVNIMIASDFTCCLVHTSKELGNPSSINILQRRMKEESVKVSKEDVEEGEEEELEEDGDDDAAD